MSVLVPVYNTAPYVAEALDSVLAQRYTNYEIVVVNDGSPDSALVEQVLEAYRARIRYIVQENRGSSGARNTALRAARGYYVALLDSDDRWHPDFLERHVAVLENDPGIDVVYADALRFDSSGQGTQRYSDIYNVGGDISFTRVLSRECQIYGEVVARKATLMGVGMYDEGLRSGEDFELWLRVLKSGGRIAYIDQVLAFYRVREGSHTSDAMAMSKSMLKLLDKVAMNYSLSPLERATLESQRTAARSELLLGEAKQAIMAGNRLEALTKLRETAKQTRNWKVRLVMLGLRAAPVVVLGLYQVRDWWNRSRQASDASSQQDADKAISQ